MRTVNDRFEDKYDMGPDCWNWQASKRRDGYGAFQIAGRMQAILTETDVLSIRARYAAGEYQRVLAKEFGVTQGSISHIVLRISWARV